MKRAFVISLLFIVTSVLFSQGQLNSDKVLKKVLENIRSHQTIEMSFRVRVSNNVLELDTSIVGMMKLKGNKFLLHATKEFIYGDGVNFITLDTLSKKFDSKKMDELDEAEVWPHTLLNFYEFGFKSHATGVKKDTKNRNIMHIDLLPNKNKKFKYRSASLEVDLDQFEITRITLTDQGNSIETVIFEILSTRFDVEMDDSIFMIDKTKYQERK